jgi:sporulation protein YlmC with PRC-barrel domain
MKLGKHVLDKELIDRHMRRAGRVDDLLLDLGERDAHGMLPEPEVKAILTGPMALSRTLSPPLQWLARRCYSLLGVSDPQPITVPWRLVTAIDVTVHLSVERDELHVSTLADAVRRRYIDRLPGA